MEDPKLGALLTSTVGFTDEISDFELKETNGDDDNEGGGDEPFKMDLSNPDWEFMAYDSRSGSDPAKLQGLVSRIPAMQNGSVLKVCHHPSRFTHTLVLSHLSSL